MRRRRISDLLWQFGDEGAGDRTFVLLAHAGGSAYSLAGLVPPLLCDGGTALAVQYPGRGPRANEPQPTSLDRFADEAARDLARAVAGSGVVLIGHSMGATIAHEVALRLEAGRHPVELLVASAARPGPARVGVERVLAMSRADWSTELDAGQPDVAADLLDLALPALRADYLMLARHVAGAGRVSCPILAVGGAEDPWVGPDHLRGWAARTTGEFSARILPGGHFYLRDDPAALCRVIHDQLPAVGAGRSGTATEQREASWDRC